LDHTKNGFLLGLIIIIIINMPATKGPKKFV
jgi:hypothetical protein